MQDKPSIKVALVGNPNAGKTSLFNALTGLHHKVGNFPGVTVERKTGNCKLSDQLTAEITDLPGTYSINPQSLDEHVVFESLINLDEEIDPDVVVVIVDETNLKRNLLLFTQIKDLGIPVILALNMAELARKTGIEVHKERLEKELQVPVVRINARQGTGLEDLKIAIAGFRRMIYTPIFDPVSYAPEVVSEIRSKFNIRGNYKAYQLAVQYDHTSFLSDKEKEYIAALRREHKFDAQTLQTTETMERYRFIDKLITKVVKNVTQQSTTLTQKLDQYITHKVWGYIIFVLILFVIFQAIFSLAAYPMDWIDEGFANLAAWVSGVIPAGPINGLLSEGIVPGIGGVLIFIPQIAILSLIIALLEESGYMSRVMFLMDKLMRRFGMNGRSVVPLVSAVACAVPAIMSTRTISSWKERMITIFVTPLMSCSARLPVYIILIALVIPDQHVLGIFSLQGLVLFGMYVFGFLMTIFSAVLMKWILKTKERNYFILELPAYRVPKWSYVGREVFQKTKNFIVDAGKIILTISIILWWLASYGPGDKMEQAEARVLRENKVENIEALSDDARSNLASNRLEASYAGHFGKWLEPAIRPLGYDWKIGIALISSFAAREVFVGTMSTIYSIGQGDEDPRTLVSRMRSETDASTGLPIFTLATALSLLVFYALAMQCMSTVAIVYKETKSWKWPVAQLVYMTALAYFLSLLTYQLFR